MYRAGGGAGAFAFWALAMAFAQAGGQASPAGPEWRVQDPAGGALSRARLWVMSASGAVVAQAQADEEGRCTLAALPPGQYVVQVEAEQFQPRWLRFAWPAAESITIVRLELAPVALGVTVTAERASVEEVLSAPQFVDVRRQEEFRRQPLRTVGQALEHSGGVLVQETTAGQSSPFLRGLTGYQTLLLLDDVRINTAMFRSGPNQYLGFVEPGQVESVEAVLGPASAAYGSDALGGAIQLRTPGARPGPRGAAWWHGEGGLFGASADLSARADATVSLGWRRAWLLLNGGWRRHNDLRAGGALDSHHVNTRYFGLPAFGRLQDTGFGQRGGMLKGGWRLDSGHDFTGLFAHGRMQDVRAYRELEGGLGRLLAQYEPQGIDLAYGRWEKLRLGPIESMRATVSMNRQQDDSRRQGLLFRDPVTAERNRAEALGLAVQGTAVPARTVWLAFGADLQRETIRSFRADYQPLTGATVEKRPLYPDGSRYRTAGLYAQGRWQPAGGRWQAGAEGRWTGVAVALGPERTAAALPREQQFRDMTWNAHLRWRAANWLAFGALAGRGFRAPNLNDVGSLGLTGLGFEVPAAEAVAAGAQFGMDASEGALPTMRAPRPLRAESLLNYEASARVSLGALTWRLQGYTFRLKDPIVRRTMLFSLTAPPAMVAGETVTPAAPTAAQRGAGVTTVATSWDARGIKAFVNDGEARYSGVETDLRWAIARSVSVEAVYSWIAGEEGAGLPARRLPPQRGHVALRYRGQARRPWMEAAVTMSGAQRRLNPGDLDDERIGASRRRADIATYFRSARNLPLLDPGADARLGTADDVLRPTGETMLQVQDRVLPIGRTLNGVMVVNDQTRVPLYLATPGWWTLRFQAGLPLGERWELSGGVENVLDRNWRGHGSGIDAAGRGFFAALRFRY